MNITVLGLGNIMFADEGFGVEAVRRLESRGTISSKVELIDGGTQGIYLLNFVEAADYLLVYDAIIPTEQEVKVYTYRDDELPALVFRKMSAHQVGLSEILTLARLHGKMPDEVVLIGVPPQNLEMHIGLSASIEALMPEALEVGEQIISRWLGVIHQ
ncbi:MAG: HyaD/HybD family hydrogenase maturation endopeptidase [Fidelibacterota bacterium]|nr:MAG: HyaD/HybD family hydrogenase maturation endopeptidase [Candidatus Neomarinimicrobiota bacterium]